MARPPVKIRAQLVQQPQQSMRNGGAAPPMSRHPPEETIFDYLKRRRREAVAQLERNPDLRATADIAANIVGFGAGVGRGLYNSAKGLADSTLLVARAGNPMPDLISGRPTAWAQVANAGLNAGNYVAQGIANPRKVVADVQASVSKAKADLLPSATPTAPNTWDELERRFSIGMNQGELGFDVGSLFVGGPLAKTAGKAADVAMYVRPVTAAKYVKQDYTPQTAAYLAEPYQKGMGSHFMPRRANPPKWFVDSDYNVLAPPGIQRGEMYELHGLVDPQFHGAGLAKRLGESWKFEKSGLKRYGPLRRLYYGAPGALKARVGGLAGAGGAASYELSADDEG